MRNKLATLFFIFFVVFNTDLQAQKNEVFDLTIEVSGLKSSKGKLFLAVYDSEENYLKKGNGKIIEIKNNQVIVTFDKIKSGFYAVSFFHDENNNGKMDSNLLGIPKESYGFSNNVKGFMGPPKFEKTKFEVSKNTKITIKI